MFANPTTMLLTYNVTMLLTLTYNIVATFTMFRILVSADPWCP